MRKIFWSLVTWWFLVSPLAAQSISFPQDKVTYKRIGGAFVPFDVEPMVDGDDVEWEIDPALFDLSARLKTTGAGKVFQPLKTGTFTVKARTAKALNIEPDKTKPAVWKAKLSKTAVLTVTITEGDDPPQPTPPSSDLAALQKSVAQIQQDVAALQKAVANLIPTPPTPGPPPAPNATAQHLYLLTFDDALQRSANTATLLGDKAYWNGVITAGHKFRAIDVKNPQAGAWQPFYTKGGVQAPALVILDADKHTWLATVALPGTYVGVDALIKQYTGK